MISNPKPYTTFREIYVERLSLDGYQFDPTQNLWQLNKDVSIYLSRSAILPVPLQMGFRSALARYAEEYSAKHTANMNALFERFLNDTNASEISIETLLNWRSSLSEKNAWYLGGLKGFLIAWNAYGFVGVTDEVCDLLNNWRIKGNEKGRSVVTECPRTGPLTDIEVQAIIEGANAAIANNHIEFSTYVYVLLLLVTARRPVQLAALRGKDLQCIEKDGISSFRLNIPRAKQRGSNFRSSFRHLTLMEDMYLVLRHQHQCSVRQLEKVLRSKIDLDLVGEVPVFLNETALFEITDPKSVSSILLGSKPDMLHVQVGELAARLKTFQKAKPIFSERTGEPIELTSPRFRTTRGTKLRREGFGPFIIAELLDHSDIQNVSVYTESTAQEAVIIDQLIGAKLAPFAQACLGKLVHSEREAIRGDDPRSRVPDHEQRPVGTCGNYGFCASGFRACYTCFHFQPWLEGPHSEVLEELYKEKRRAQDAGCAREVIDANDQLILAVEHCVSMCQEMKSTAAQSRNLKVTANG